MLVTRSQSKEQALREQRSQGKQQQHKAEEEQEQQEAVPAMNAEMDPRSVILVIGGVTYSSRVSFDDVVSDEFRTIGNIPWFRRQAVMADAESDFEVLDRYAWDGEFYWGVKTNALRSIVWREAIAFDVIYLTTRGSMSNEVVKHTRDRHKG